MGKPAPDLFWEVGNSMAETSVLEKLPYIMIMLDEFADLMMAVARK